MAYADAIKYNVIRSMKGLPIGAIVPWSSDQSNIPTGWIVCNGATIATTRYPLLFSVIGNSYGGTAGSTFRIPPLTNSGKAVMDIFRGHYQHLKTNGGAANAPTSATIAQDTFWTIVSNGNGDEGSSTQSTYISTIDVVGQITGTPTFQAIYDPITISDGSFSYVAVWAQTRLRAQNMPSHSHSAPGNRSLSYRNNGGSATDCGGTGTVGSCTFNCTSTSAWRVAQQPPNGTREAFANDTGDLNNNFNRTDETGLVGTGGGGGIRASNAAGESGSTVYVGGDGICQGDMNCNGGLTTLFTSLSNSETTLGAVAPHEHGTVNYNLTGRYRVISPGLRDNIQLNTVSINNEAGRNFCTITADVTTPSLEMLYIIRAF